MPKPVLKAGSRPPWVGLAAAVWVQISAGNGLTFALYSPALKSVLGFNQLQLTILGVANDIGENVGLLPGIACNKFPPWAVLLVGAVACSLGYGVVWLAVSQTVQSMPFWVLWLALVLATNGNAWFMTAVLVTNMRNFPLSRGTVAGILKGYVGISAAVYTVLYSFILKQSAANLLLLLTLGLPIVSLSMMYFIRPCTPASGEDSSVHVHFIFAQAASFLLALYLLVITIVDKVVTLNAVVSYVLVAVMVILLMSPLAIPIKMTLFPAKSKKLNGLPGSSDHLAQEEGHSTQTPLLSPSSSASHLGSFHESGDVSDVETLLAEGEGAVKKKRKPRRGEDFKFGQALVKADFWLLWLIYFLGIGSGVTVMNNLAQIALASGVENTTTLITIFSFSNFVGRLGSGAISEHFIRSRMIPRPFWITLGQLLMVVTFLLYALSLNGTLYIATSLLGVCFGFQYLAIPTVSELFGLKHFGIIYNFLQMGNPIGAFLFSSMLAAYVYDAEAAKQGSTTCVGPDCFRLTFLVLSGVCGLGIILSIILTVRVRPVYQMLYSPGSFHIPQASNH